MKKRNTFGNYKFDDWVCEKAQEMIRDFWGQIGSTYKDWQNGAKENKNRFPKHGEFVYVPKRRQVGMFGGRFLYLWDNIGTIINNEETYSVSTCDTFYKKYDL